MDPPTEILEQVERRLIGPMHVFDHDQRLHSLEFIERGREDQVGACAGTQGRRQATLRLPRDVMERRQGARCKESVACSPQHAHPLLPLRERLQQGCLADTRLTSDKGGAAAMDGGTGKPVCQVGEPLFSLEQFHRSSTRGTPRRRAAAILQNCRGSMTRTRSVGARPCEATGPMLDRPCAGDRYGRPPARDGGGRPGVICGADRSLADFAAPSTCLPSLLLCLPSPCVAHPTQVLTREGATRG